MPKYAGADWLESNRRLTAERKKQPFRPMSVFARKVADVLGQVIRGLYHWEQGGLDRADWTIEDRVSLTWYGDLSTYDSAYLTELVVLCHDHAIRLCINAASPRYLRLTFTPRSHTAP